MELYDPWISAPLVLFPNSLESLKGTLLLCEANYNLQSKKSTLQASSGKGLKEDVSAISCSFLQKWSAFCENLRLSVVSCAVHMLEFSQEKCENQCHFRSVPFNAPWESSGTLQFKIFDTRSKHDVGKWVAADIYYQNSCPSRFASVYLVCCDVSGKGI